MMDDYKCCNEKIQINNLSFFYDEKNVFMNYSAIFPANQVSIIMSPSGRGKTTLLYLIAGLLKPNEGEILYPVDKPKFSFVFQDDRLIDSLSIVKNIKLVNSHLSDEEIKDCLAHMGVDVSIRQRVRRLSGGERQRVAIARALLAEFDILLMDEPFTGIDDKNKEKVIRYLKEKTEGKTCILVTHDETEAKAVGGRIYNIL